MKEISDELARIATLLGVQYLRASDISDSNMLTHYEAITGGLILYTGFADLSYEFAGAMPVDTVPVTVYCLYINPSKDETAEQIDDLLALAERLAADVIYNFKTPYNDIVSFDLLYTKINDSLLTGYRLEFDAAIEGLTCSV